MACVVSLQNGFNELIIAEAVGEARTMGAFINFGADVIEPGVIHFGGRGASCWASSNGGRRDPPRPCTSVRCASSSRRAIVTNNIWGYLWGKMGYGALLFATALTDASIVDVLASREVRPALTMLAREVMAVAAAEDVEVMGFNGYDPAAFGPHGNEHAIDRSFDAMVAFNRRSAKTHTGVWRDIAIHHRPTECDAQFGPILALARRRDIEVPNLERLVAVMRGVESGRLPQAWQNLARLEAAKAKRGTDAHPL